MKTDMIEIALNWLNRGIAVIPIGYKSKRPNRRFLQSWDEYKTRLPTVQEINNWFVNTYTNIAVICGWQNLVVLDFDKIESFWLWAGAYSMDTYTVTTGRGCHLYFYCQDFPNQTLKWYGGEIKASGYCLAPPSIHPTGTSYKVKLNAPIATIDTIHDVMPRGIFDKPSVEVSAPPVDIFGLSSCEQVKQSVRLLDYFQHTKQTGHGWYTVQCPFHGDGNHWSGWVNDNKNRYGCHACITGSLSVIDFHMRLYQIDFEQAIRELIQ